MMTKGNGILAGVIAAYTTHFGLFVNLAEESVRGMTAGRARSMAAVVVGLISLVAGGLTLARSARRNGSGRTGATVSLVSGLIGVVLSVVHLAGSTGFGTGGGRAGAIVALVLSLAGMTLGGLALTRSRRSGSTG